MEKTSHWLSFFVIWRDKHSPAIESTSIGTVATVPIPIRLIVRAIRLTKSLNRRHLSLSNFHFILFHFISFLGIFIHLQQYWEVHRYRSLEAEWAIDLVSRTTLNANCEPTSA
jgi:uncharacterized protein with PQ loop repeat